MRLERPRLTSTWACAAAALAISCGRAPAPIPAGHPDVRLAAETEIIESRVPQHATLDSLLRDNHLQSALVVVAVAAAQSVFNPRQLRADRPYRLVRSLDGLLREFEYEIDADKFLRIVNSDRSRPEALDAQVLPYDKKTSVTAIDALVDSDHPSLIAAIDEAGENVQLAMALAEIFAGQVDFESDLQPGDTFRVVFEKSTRDGEFAGYGAILAASMSVEGRTCRAFRWTDPASGRASYYDADGRSLKRFFLRSPLRFQPRITSGFSLHRFHPVYREYRAHLGVDYGAPTGAPVIAVANGVVVSAGFSGGGGNLVHLKHASGFETYYLHLSAFGKGVRAGARVQQGQLIGKVGATGTATGPHLDYRLKKNGKFVNPLTEHRKLPPGEPIAAAHLASFRSSRDGILKVLAAPRLAGGPPQKPDAVSALRPR